MEMKYIKQFVFDSKQIEKIESIIRNAFEKRYFEYNLMNTLKEFFINYATEDNKKIKNKFELFLFAPSAKCILDEWVKIPTSLEVEFKDLKSFIAFKDITDKSFNLFLKQEEKRIKDLKTITIKENFN